jgi:hypothetical protein
MSKKPVVGKVVFGPSSGGQVNAKRDGYVGDCELEYAPKGTCAKVAIQAAEIARLKGLVREMATGIDKIARLGSEPYLGNSIGNCMAQDILNLPEVQSILIPEADAGREEK